MLRLDTTLATAEGTAFTPETDMVLQAAFNPLANPTIAIMCRNDPAAAWQVLTLWKPANEPFVRLDHGTEVFIRATKNIAGSQLRVWDDA